VSSRHPQIFVVFHPSREILPGDRQDEQAEPVSDNPFSLRNFMRSPYYK